MARDCSQLERLLGHNFSQPELLQRALAHSSYTRDHNERLEFLGDSVAGLIISDELYRHFPDCPEGDLSRMRASLISRHTMAQVALEFDLGSWLRLGAGEMKSGGAQRESNLANALEAVIGAIYLDAGYQTCVNCILSWYQSRLQSLQPGQRDAKSRLQEYLQAKRKPLPVYEVVSVEGPADSQVFTSSCKVVELEQAQLGSDRNRRRAEQAAAAAVLEQLGIADD